MQYNVDNSEIAVTLTSSKFDVAVTAQTPIEVDVGDAARMDVGAAVNYIKSGQAEIEQAVADGTAAFNLNASQKTNDFNANASNKTSDFNTNAINKTNDFDNNASDKTSDFNSNASDKTTDFNDNYTVKKGLIDAEVANAEGYAADAKQWAIGDPSEPTGNSAKYWANEAATTLNTKANIDLSNLSATGEAKFVQPSQLATVATSGSYTDLINKPTIPTVNNATITITQGGVTKGSFTLNQASGDTIALDAGGGGGSSYTAGTGIDITSDVISVVGVKDQNNTSTAIKTWTGTRAQYNAITTKDANTLYNITDDTNITPTLLESLYPVGSIYIGTMSICPLAALGIGTWQLVASDRVLQGSGTNSVGSTIAAGLPNITSGNWGGILSEYDSTEVDGSAVRRTSYVANGNVANGSHRSFYNFDASRSSSIYGNSNTVQPSAYVVNIWERTA